MKKVLIIMALFALAATPMAFAEEITVYGAGHADQKIKVHDHLDSHMVAGAKVDAPNLVRFTEDLTVGVEGGKDILNDPFQGDTRSYFESDKGYFGYLKLTFTGSLFDLSKK